MSQKLCARSYGKVYLRDNKACYIVDKGDVWLNLPNGDIWFFNGVRHIPKLKIKLNYVGQLVILRHPTIFTGSM